MPKQTQQPVDDLAGYEYFHRQFQLIQLPAKRRGYVQVYVTGMTISGDHIQSNGVSNNAADARATALLLFSKQCGCLWCSQA